MVNSQHDLALYRTLMRLIQPRNMFTSGQMSVLALNVPRDLQLIIMSKLTSSRKSLLEISTLSEPLLEITYMIVLLTRHQNLISKRTWMDLKYLMIM